VIALASNGKNPARSALTQSTRGGYVAGKTAAKALKPPPKSISKAAGASTTKKA
jgi:hypothetical protein